MKTIVTATSWLYRSRWIALGFLLSTPTILDTLTGIGLGADENKSQRFVAQPGFAVEQVLGNKETGSLIAMAFNEFGHILASREAGPLLLIYDSDKDGLADKVKVYCELVENIQGILPLNGDVFVTGDGSDGHGLYKLSDSDRNGSLEDAQRLLSFEGSQGEHGAHQIALGPDGMLYVMVGNHVQIADLPKALAAYGKPYEGDLMQPRFEDPGGHAAGIKAPGGTVIRCDVRGQNAQVVAGGLRNAYDLAFHPGGALFAHDSDMEADVGATWYRPTCLFEIMEGGEYGWRSGWAQWPDYYPDRLPTVIETGRGSPTGAVVYDHYAFPSRYQRSLLLADWSEGRILSVTLKPKGASFQAQAEVLVRGEPLNVTDLDVSPDGCVYFTTGGRSTEGGLFRIRWKGEASPEMKNLGQGIAKAIRQPQMTSAWARQEVALLKKELGSAWDEMIAGVAYSPDNPARYRMRALELMQLLGPVPSTDLLVDLSRSPNEAVRGRTAQLLGLQTDEGARKRLTDMLKDPDRMVQRFACESLHRMRAKLDPNVLTPLLISDDRTLAFAARRLLENIDPESWKSNFLASDNHRMLIQAGLALMIAHPTRENAMMVIQVYEKTMQEFVSDRDFVEMLRVAQLALHRSGIQGQDLPAFRNRVAREFPAGEPVLNRELIRLAAYLQCDEMLDRALTYLQGNASEADRIHVAMHLQYLTRTWSPTQRYALLKFFEDVIQSDNGSSVPLYLMQASQNVAQGMSLEEARIFLADGEQWPNAALSALFQLPAKVSPQEIQMLIQLDSAIDQSGLEADCYKRLKTGITAVLARNGDSESVAYLREAWRRSPDRRGTISLGLAMQPGGENWDYLVRSLPHMEIGIAQDVMKQLCTVPDATEDAEVIRQVILQGLRMQVEGVPTKAAEDLLTHWLGSPPSLPNADENQPMMAWQAWFAKKHPDSPSAELPKDDAMGKWSLVELTEYLESDQAKIGVPSAGKLAYEKAKCASCHRFGTHGKSIGPDLSSVAKRFTRQESLESILFPSHVISDQFSSKKVVTVHGNVLVGLVNKTSQGSLRVLHSDLTETLVPKSDLDEVLPSKVSMMPSGLLDALTLEEVRDLFCYMGYVPHADMARRPAKGVTR